MKLHHIALKSSDIEKTLAFYTAIGMRHVAEWGEGTGRTVMLDIGEGTRLEIFANGGDEFPPRGKWLHLALASDDVDASYAAALAAGAGFFGVQMNTLSKKYVGNWRFYKGVLTVMLPILVQNAITNFFAIIAHLTGKRIFPYAFFI